ncbi:MAG TPA: FadR/GntR family transcriptional regulator, partial [Rectinema sp.]|nr:FadR/GntR family transcriptional regulator [Rectinema sp.]
MYVNLSSKKQRSQEVASHIKELIRDEKLKPGEKLPNELELCSLFSVSRPTIREAVKILISQGIIEIRRGKGTYVTEVPGIAQDPLGLDFITTPNLRLDIIEARLLIEPGAARLAAQKADSNDIAKIAASVKAMEEVVYRHKVEINAELDFHRSIAEATRNPVIMRIIPIIMESIEKTYQDAPRTSEDHRHAFEEHKLIYKAI